MDPSREAGRGGALRLTVHVGCPDRFVAVLLAVLALFCAREVAAQETDDSGNSPIVPIREANLSGTDDLGRTLPTYAETGDPRPARWVGLFYWFWHRPTDHWGPDYDMTKFLQGHPNFWPFHATAPGEPSNPTWYWGEPLDGYYRSTDPWVMRQHLGLISHLGVDFLVFDYTNGDIYDPELTTFLQVAEEMKKNGLQVPRLVFFLHTDAEWKIEAMYNEWYQPGKHDDMWFRWQGKPLILAPLITDAKKLKDPSKLGAINAYFTWRPAGWPDEDPQHPHTHWLYADENISSPANGPDGKIEQVCVSKSMGGPIWDNMQKGGVSCTPDHIPTYNDQYISADCGKGLYLQHQFDLAEKLNAPVMWLTGWNELSAAPWEQPGVVFLNRSTKAGEAYFVDEFNMDFNRDIEPMKGGYNDNFYMQAVENLRKYKGMVAPDKPSAETTIPLDGRFGAWNSVRPIYRDVVGDSASRNWDGAPPGTHYTNNSARNDIALAQVARDSDHVYFHVVTAQPLSPATDKNWMLLLVDSDANASTGWHGYDYLINRSRTGNTCTVEQNVDGGWNWKPVGTVPFSAAGSDLAIAVPKQMIGLDSPQGLKFDFKWVDNIPDQPTIMDFYTQGDAAPDGRFNFRFDDQLGSGN